MKNSKDKKTGMKKPKKHIRDFFIPHEGNDHRPKSLHPKSLAVYLFIAIMLKVFATGALFFIYPDPASMARIIAEEMIQLTNQARKEDGEPLLKVSPVLSKAALQKGEDMMQRGYFSHDTPEGKKPWSWIDKKDYDYIFAGENLAMDFTSGEMIQKAFMKSPSHRRNILDIDFKEIGVAVVSGKMFGNDTDILVIFFGTKRKDYVVAKKETKTSPRAAIIQPTPTPRIANDAISAEKGETSEGIIVLGSEKKSSDDLITFIIEWMNMLFIAFVLYVGMCLILNIFIKIKIQHQSLILQSIVVLSLIISLLITKLHFVEKITTQLKIL